MYSAIFNYHDNAKEVYIFILNKSTCIWIRSTPNCLLAQRPHVQKMYLPLSGGRPYGLHKKQRIKFWLHTTKFQQNFIFPPVRSLTLIVTNNTVRMAFSLQVAGSMRSYILCCIPPVGRSCAYASSMSWNHVLWKLTVFSREHQLRDYGRPCWGEGK